MKYTQGRIFVPGGIVSPGELRHIVNTIQYFGAESIQIGDRQDLFFYFDGKYESELRKRLGKSQYHFATDKEPNHNIVTSLASKDIFNSTPWLAEDVYLEILSSFNYDPVLKVNITDPAQTLVPLFSGDLNFIASPHDNYWYLYIKLPGASNFELWPVLVDGNEIAVLSKEVEELMLKVPNLSMVKLETYIYNLRSWNFRILDKSLEIPPYRFSDYEGFHSLGQKTWLGIYRKDNIYSVSFIENLCMVCFETSIGSINLTTWSSIIVKNIEETQLGLWEKLLGKFGVATGHSHLELNWLLPDGDKETFLLKERIVNEFSRRGLRTEGVVFGIQTKSVVPACSILIKKKSLFKIGNRAFFSTYDVKYRKDFDINSTDWVSVIGGLKRRHLPNILSYILGIYYDKMSRTVLSVSSKNVEKVAERPSQKKSNLVYQCKACFTVYDPKVGDELAMVPAGTPINQLPPNYKCSLCEGPVENFIQREMDELVVK